MVQGHPVADASAAIVANQREGRKAQLTHHVHQFLGHSALGIRQVVGGRSGYAAAAVGAQVYADHGMVLCKPRREDAPHQAGAREAMHQQNRWLRSIAAHEDRVAGNLNLCGGEWPLMSKTCTCYWCMLCPRACLVSAFP